MRTQETTQNPQIILAAGEKKYQVLLEEASNFFINCAEMGLVQISDIEHQLSLINDNVIDSLNDDLPCHESKISLKLIRELVYLFKGVFYEQRP